MEENNKIEITAQTRDNLCKLGKWASFLAWLMIIITALYFVLGVICLFIGDNDLQIEDNPTPGYVIGITMLLCVALIVYPTLCLYKAGKSLKALSASDDAEKIEIGAANLKSYFKFSGIVSIVCVALVLVCVIIVACISLAA